MAAMILVISPHGDDAELGMGATIAKLVAAGERVRHVVLTTSGYENGSGQLVTDQQRLDEAASAARTLGVELHAGPFEDNHLSGQLPGIVSYLDDVLSLFKPMDVFTCLPWFNADHDAVYKATLASMRRVGLAASFWAYEMPMQHLGCLVPESGWWYHPVSQEDTGKKIRALLAYESQKLGDKDGPVSVHGALRLMELRGTECCSRWAERQLLLRGVAS